MNGALRWWHLFAAWLATFFAFAAVAHGNLETTDAGITMVAARNLGQRGDSGIRRADQGGQLLGEQLAAEYIRSGACGKIGVNGIAYTWFPMGHVWLLVPFTVAGDALDRAWPSVANDFRARVAPGLSDAQLGSSLEYVQGNPVLTQGLISLLVPASCMATTLLLLLLLGRVLGANSRDAAIAALAIVLATQCFSFGRETLSDGPGLTALLGALVAVVAVHQGRGTLFTSCAGGFAAGAAVLLRYQNALLLAALAIALALACHRQRRWRDALAFALGGLPALLLLLAVNDARFGSVFDTGYPAADAWLVEPMWLGALKILFGAGRGVAWFSPLVWLALPLALSRRSTPRLRWLGLVMFLVPLGFFALATGWQGGQCWAARYVTHGLVAWLALTLPQTRPWRRWPKAWIALLCAGLFVNATSVVAPVRGVLQLASQAVEATGAVATDAHDLAGWQPRYTPLLANWRYAAASCVGGFEGENGEPRHGSAHTIEALFGIAAKTDTQAFAPMRWEDRCGRHLWWRFWGDVLGCSSLWLLLPTLLLAAAAAWLARPLFATAPSDSSTPR